MDMSQESSEKKRQLLTEAEFAAERWKESPYGYLWITEGMLIEPTSEEFTICENKKLAAEAISFLKPR